MIISSSTSFTIPAGSSAIFRHGGSGSATVFVGKLPGQQYTIGTNEVFLGPFDASAVVNVSVSNGSIEYIIDSDGSMDDQAPAIAAINERLLSVPVSVKEFGAIGDGVSDDSTAIRAANDSSAAAIFFPPGSYKAKLLTMTKPWHCQPGAEIVFSGATGQVLVTCSASGASGDLVLSGGGLSPAALLSVTGSNNRFGTVNVKNINSPIGSGTNTGVTFFGDGNTIDDLVVSDFINSGNTNDSMPQAVATSTAADGNLIGSVSAKNIACCLVTNSTGKLSVGTCQVSGASDNGVYALAGHLDVLSLGYNGVDEPIASTGGSISIGTAVVTKAGNSAVSVLNSGDINIGTLVLKNDGVSSVLKTRTGNVASGKITIGQLIGEFTGNTLINCTIGTCDFLSMPYVDLQYNWASAVSGSLSQWCRLDSFKGFNIGPWNIRVVDTSGDTVSGQFQVNAPTTNLSKISFAKSVDVGVYRSDKITPSTAGEVRLFDFAQTLIRSAGMRWQMSVGPYGKQVGYAEPNTVSAIPTLGTWRQGERLYNRVPAVGQPKSWVCTVAGTPGTWVSEGNL